MLYWKFVTARSLDCSVVIVQPYWFPAAAAEFKITVHCLDSIVSPEYIGAAACFLPPRTTPTFEL